jgi:pyridoxal 5'-phosphate synthase pdxT subunit
MKAKPRVGILAFQGDFAKHQEAFARLGCLTQLVKSKSQLQQIDCLVMPGGESSVIDRFVRSQQLGEPIREFSAQKPVWGTCAGMILLASQIDNDPRIEPLRLIEMTVDRNAYGRQYESFVDFGEFSANGKSEKLEMVFIRAPKVTAIGNGVAVIGRCRGDAVIVQQDKVIASAFHPELTRSTRFQEYFLSLV